LHDAGPVAGEHAGDLAERLIDAGVQRLLLVLRCATENVACDLRGMAGVADAQPQAMKSVVVAQTGDGVAQSVVPAMSATLLAFHHAGGQVELVVSDQDFLGGDAVEARHGGNGLAAAVHEGSGDEQTKVLTVESETTGQAEKLFFLAQCYVVHLGEALNEKGARVVPGHVIFRARITETDDQPDTLRHNGRPLSLSGDYSADSSPSSAASSSSAAAAVR